MSLQASSICTAPSVRPIPIKARIPVLVRLLMLFAAWIGAGQSARAQEMWTLLPSIPDFRNTEAKPQSKVWFHGHTFWAVLAGSAGPHTGTWLMRLEPDNTWAYALQLSTNTGTKADVKEVGDVVHILMHNSGSHLLSLQYNAALKTYEPWSVRPTPTPVYVGETGTIDIDSTGRMWLATESVGIEMFYSDYPYTAFTGPIVIANDVDSDDIAAVTALPNNTIGVFWSNQATQLFAFKYHVDGADPAIWSADEAPGAENAVPDGIGLAEDHINTAVAPDGTLYVAIKTGYSNPALPTIGLFVRRPDGTWDDLYYVDTVGTRPIVVFSGETNTIRVFYTSTTGTLYFRESPASVINFGPIEEVLSGDFNDVTSLKDAWEGRLLVLTSSLTTGTAGVVMQPDPSVIAHYKMDEGAGTKLKDVSGYGNDADLAGSPAWSAAVKGMGLNLDGSTYGVVSDQAQLDVTTALTISAWIQPMAQADQELVSRAGAGIDGYTFGLSSATSPNPGTVFLKVNEATFGDAFRLNSLTQYPVGGYSWMHVAATYDGTTMRMYINGVEENSMVGPLSIGAGAVDFGIGAHHDGTNRFSGMLDDLKIYNRALSAAEIGSLMGSGPPQADLAITKDDFVTKVNLGDPITYVIEAHNYGPNDVTGAMVKDLMPPQLANVTWTCVGLGGATCGGASGTGSIIDFVNLPVGTHVTYTVHAALSEEASGTLMTNTATIRASHTSDPVAGNNSATDVDELPFIIEAHFDAEEDGFAYADDMFRSTAQPTLAAGAYAPAGGFNGGGLQVLLGGVNGSNIQKISGGWRRSFNLGTPGQVSLSFRYKLSMINSRTDRFGQVLVALDGALKGIAPNDYIVQLFGTGGGGTSTTGWQQVELDLGELAAGIHTLDLGGYLSRKSQSGEYADIYIDDVRVLAGAVPGPGDLPVPPSIITPPANVTVTEPASAAFAVTVAGDAPFTYQWRRNGVDIAGANSTSYVLNPTAIADNGAQFDVVVTNAGGTVTSVAATLTVNPAPVAPSITTQPVSTTVTEPAAATFSVVATGDAPLSYQWRRNGVAIAGATGASYVLDPTAVADNGALFDVVVSNAAGSVTSAAATLTVNAALVPPSITTQPVNVTVTSPAAGNFSVVAAGSATLTYQWYRNSVAIPGAVASSYSLTPTAVTDSGSTFYVVVTNDAGSVTSASVTLTVNEAPTAPSITTPPASTTVTAPDAATFSVVASGTAPLTYQWRRNGSVISGATDATYVRNPTSMVDNGASFTVTVTNSVGSVTSAAAILTVNPPPVAPSITTQPASVTVTAPAPATFSVVASGDAPLTYQWRRNGVDIAGATSSSYVLDPTAVSDNGATFDVVVTNVAGSATSAAATLTVFEGVTSAVFEAHFEGGSSDGFSYADDFFGTVQPNFASGTILPSGGFSGGGAQVLLGGISSSNVANMSGAWHRSFALASTATATVTFRYQVTGNNLDSSELGRMLVSLNGVLKGIAPNAYVAQVGGTGVTMTTGWQQVSIDLGTLGAGNHVLALGGYLTRKTSTNETADIQIDDVVLTVEQ
jgi:uncharacterized repeat protein (TIGR01451 family)